MCETAAKARGSRGESAWGWACSIFQIINVWCIYRQLPIFTQVRHSDTRSLKNRWMSSHDHILQDTSKCINSSVEILSQFRDNTTSLHPAVRASQSVLRSSCNNVPEWKPSGRSQIQICEEYKLPVATIHATIEPLTKSQQFGLPPGPNRSYMELNTLRRLDLYIIYIHVNHCKSMQKRPCLITTILWLKSFTPTWIS